MNSKINIIKCFSISIPKNIKATILFGPPGVGKGTYGQLLTEDFNFNKITPGNLLRDVQNLNISNYTKDRINQDIRNGIMVSDEIICDLIFDKNVCRDFKEPVLLDGFPRNLNQLNKLYKKISKDEICVINILLDRSILIEKLVGRRVCSNPKCGRNYNIVSINRLGYKMKALLPKVENTCDKCQTSPLIQRNDDTNETIKNRLDIYDRETNPVLNKLIADTQYVLQFDPKNGVDDYFVLKEEIIKLFKLDN